MKLALAATIVACVALAGAAHAVDVYKWKDSHGVVHYGDRPASGVAATRVELPDDAPSAEDVEAAGDRLKRDRDQLAASAPEAPRPVAAPPRRKVVSYDCEQQWARYEASQACYINHRAAEGKGVSPAGIALCRPLPEPSCER